MSNYKYIKKQNFSKNIPIFIIISLLCIIEIHADKIKEDNLELIFVYQHVRHGARGPSSSYNSLFKNGIDEFKVSWKGEGDGELTLVGRREHYDLGVRNRLKYGKWEGGLGLIDFSVYNPEEILFHVTDYNRTHQSLNSELIGMYQPGIAKTLTEKQVDGSFPPNEEIWRKNYTISPYKEILQEIDDLGNQSVIDNIPIFNVHPFPANRTFNFESNCKNLDNLRKESLIGKDELLYGYFLEHKDELRTFFGFENDSYFTDIRMMNSITDHYISDYKNYKDLSEFEQSTNIKLDVFMDKCGKFYHDWMYNYYCTNITCSMDSSRLMEDLLGYMKRRIQHQTETTYKAPKMVIDCGHDTTVAPMQMFMYETWKDNPNFHVKTQYCGFACNIYFELYKDNSQNDKYLVYYYIDDERIDVFDYDEFDQTVRAHLYTQEDIIEHCLTEEDRQKRKEEEERRQKEEEGDTFIESLNKHTFLWIGLFSFAGTTLLSIIAIIVLGCKIHRIKHPKKRKMMNVKESELSSKFVTSSEVDP